MRLFVALKKQTQEYIYTYLRVERLEEHGSQRALHRLLPGAQPLQSLLVALIPGKGQEDDEIKKASTKRSREGGKEQELS